MDKIPNKVYLAFEDGFVAQSANVKEDASGHSIFLEGLEPKEFVNKDELLDWAKKELEYAELTNFDEFGKGEVVAWRSIVDKLNQL